MSRVELTYQEKLHYQNLKINTSHLPLSMVKGFFKVILKGICIMINTITLQNGVKIVFEKMPFVRSISFGVWVKNGSRHESEDTSGISHFIEHMLFKGTSKRSAKDIADKIDSIGGQFNAYTSKEYTCYYTRTLDSHFDIALDLLSDMFFNSKFDKNEIDKEKNVILEEVSMYEDTPEEVAHDLLQYNIWQNSSLRLPILGTEKNISSFNQNIFKEYYNSNYHPHNIVIAVAGNFEEKSIIKKLEKYFGNPAKTKGNIVKKDDIRYKSCVVTKEKDIEQLHMIAGFSGIPLTSEDTYTMSILNTIFGGGMSSRIFQKIREEHGLAYSVYSYHSAYEDVGLFSIYAGLNKSNAESVLNHIVNEIKRLYKDKITLEQLNLTKEQIKSNYLLSLESTSSRMSSLGRSQTMLKRVSSANEVVSKIDKITIDKVYDVAQQVLNLENMSLSVVGNVKDLNFKEMLDNAR